MNWLNRPLAQGKEYWWGKITAAPLTFAIMYIFCIAIFTAIYHAIPSGFYAPYVRMETYGVEEASNIGDIFKNAIKRRIAELGIGRYASKQNKVYIKDLRVSGRINNDSVDCITLTIFMAYGTENVSENGLFGLKTCGHTGILVRTLDKPDRSYQPVEIVNVSLRKKQLSSGERSIADVLFTSDVSADSPMLQVTDAEEERIEDFFDGIEGDPISISGSWPRMAYLSCIVITTLGFGDIVPIRSIARLAVAAEAILGIALMGLFLNAVATQAARKAASSKDP